MLWLPLSLRKPARYINHEFNTIKKEGTKKLLFALCYPDLYEVGASNIGLQILYGVLNSLSFVACERVFAPYPDFENYMRENRIPITSLESRRPLSNFDVIGFSVQYELTYTNMLTILHLSGIPIRKEERKDGHPIVIAGGPCAFNPQPLFPFVDVFFIGEGEEGVVEMAKVLFEGKKERAKREEIIKELSKVEGVLVEGKRAKRRVVKNLEESFFPENPIVPITRVVHERATVEIARGCVNGCRFCQAGFIYRPYRAKSPEKVIRLTEKILYSTGYDELSLLSLSTSDYPWLEELLTHVRRIMEERKVLLSLPSVRVGSVTPKLLKTFSGFKKPTLTFAPETGSEKLQRIINKRIDLDLLGRDINTLFKNGWRRVKLYFMLGLPEENEDDLKDTLRLLKDISRFSKRRDSIQASFSIFTPKPFSPFEKKAQEDLKTLEEKLKFLRENLKSLKLSFSLPDPVRCKIEALMARGDKEAGDIVYRAWEMGARLDAWEDKFKRDIWLSILGREWLDKATSKVSTTWWELVDPGIDRRFFEREEKLSRSRETSPSCFEGCSMCGACEGKLIVKKESVIPLKEREAKKEETKASNPVKKVLYIRKMGISRYLSHLDLYATVIKLLRRSKMPLFFSKGFHPNPVVSFESAYPLGVELFSEPFILKLSEDPGNLDPILKEINKLIPKGLGISIEAKKRALGNIAPENGTDIYLVFSDEEASGLEELKAIPEELRGCEGKVYMVKVKKGVSLQIALGKDWHKRFKRVVKL